LRILSNLSRLRESTETAYALLHGADGACTENLAKVINRLRDMTAIDPGIGNTLSMVESAMPLLEDAAIELRDIKGKYDMDPERIEEVQDRLELIRKLEKKYGASVDTVLEYRDKASEELKALEFSDERLQTLDASLNKMEALKNACRDLSGGERPKKTRTYRVQIRTCIQ
jgi:DNA repair protein RecN (Recombination protein N)